MNITILNTDFWQPIDNHGCRWGEDEITVNCKINQEKISIVFKSDTMNIYSNNKLIVSSQIESKIRNKDGGINFVKNYFKSYNSEWSESLRELLKEQYADDFKEAISDSLKDTYNYE